MPVLTTLAEQAAEGCLVKPLFYQWVLDDRAASINLIVERPAPRQPDGRFHASSHPLATNRELWLWLAGRAVPDVMDYRSRLAVMYGQFSHSAFEAFLEWTGKSVPLPSGDCPACGRPRRPLRARPGSRYCTEHGFAHPGTRSSCHLDAILDFGDGLYGFDLKTIWTLGLKDVRDMDLARFREKWPRYWAQMQECMRLSGLRQYIVFFFSMGSPWDTREFHVPFDPEFAVRTEEKYRRVISCWERGIEVLG